MKRYTETSPRKKMPLFSEELAELIEKGRHGNENMFVLTVRRGLYPFTVCRDCGRSVLCRVCSAPIVLHTKGKHTKGAMALCHKCGDRKNAADACNHCGGWRLETLGIGIQRAEEELKERFDGIRVFRIDRDTVRTHKKALEIRDMFYNTPGSILLGTEMAISYLNKEVPNVAVLSVDSLFTIPDFRINERVFGMLLRLRERAGKHFLIQTRDIDNRIFEYAAGGNMMDFYRGEIAERKILGYPPFSTLIKITVEGTKLAVERHIARAEKLLAAYKPLSFPAFTEKIKGRHRMNILLKLPKEMWIDETLLELLYSLPPSFAVRVDPEDVL